MPDYIANVQKSFDTSFCQLLEYHLSYTMRNSTDKVLKYFWCDGVDEPIINGQFTDRNITTINKVVIRAWFGTSGQDRYQMTIKLGRCARRKALKGEDISVCLPDVETATWDDMDRSNYSVSLQLN
ncbi:MAG TPA: hypothetical protein VHA56_19590 [Mucilaginibacter sp.]|nr:hypothetical protein [Mucilaginibacter sp.]